MNVKTMLPLGPSLFLFLAASDVQAAEKTYECFIQDSEEQPTGGSILKSLRIVTAVTVADAEKKALEDARKIHGDAAATAKCMERMPSKNM